MNCRGKGYPLRCEEHLTKAFGKNEERKGGREEKRRSFRRAEKWISRICKNKAKKTAAPPRLPSFIGAEQSSVSNKAEKTVRKIRNHVLKIKARVKNNEMLREILDFVEQSMRNSSIMNANIDLDLS